jgi:hypothetical protein
MFLEQMRRLVLQEVAGENRRDLNVDAVRAGLDEIDRDLLLVVPLGSLACHYAVLPGVPRTHHELATHPSFGKRSATMIAISEIARKVPSWRKTAMRWRSSFTANGTRSRSSASLPNRCQVATVFLCLEIDRIVSPAVEGVEGAATAWTVDFLDG